MKVRRGRKEKKGVVGLDKSRLRKQSIKAEHERQERAEAQASGVSVEVLRQRKLEELKAIKDRKPVAATAPVPAPDLRHPTNRGKIVWDGYRKQPD